MDLSVSGLASGMDWKTLVSQLADVERAPEKQLQNEQLTLRQQNNAYGSIQTQLSTFSNRVSALKDTSIFQNSQAQVSDSTVASAKAASGTSPGSYVFNIQQLPTAATQIGASDVGGPLSTSDQVSGVILATAGLSTTITEGTFSVNGQKISVAKTDSLQDVFDRIATATNSDVTAVYDPTTDKISLSSNSEIVLGSAADTSNFLQAVKLFNNGTGSVSSSASLGGINQETGLKSANFSTVINDGGSGTGSFTINGVSISYNATNDSLSNVIQRINSSSAGVTARYDAVADRMVLTNKSTGDVGISLQDVSGNFLAATGLIGGTLQHGSDLLYTINGGGQLSTRSKTISEESSGIKGLSVTALTKGTVEVSISSDTEALKQAIKDFVTEFNSAQSVIDTNTASSTDSTGKVTAGVLAGTGDADEIATTLRRLASARGSGSASLIKSLDDLGISTNGNDNKLQIDDTKLSAALENNLSEVQDLFTNANTGLATKLSGYLDKIIGDDGSLIKKQSNVSKQISDLDTQIGNIERQVTADSDAMKAEFVAMESAQAAAQQQIQYLNQTFNGGSSSSSSSKK